MKRNLLIVGLLTMLVVPVFALTPTECIEIYDERSGDKCNSGDSLSIKFRNGCNQRIDMKVCLQKRGGAWDCVTQSSMPPGANSSNFVCSATGRYKREGRLTGSDTKFSIP